MAADEIDPAKRTARGGRLRRALPATGQGLGAAIACALWLGVASPGLELLPGVGGLADESIEISLQSAMLGIDDASGRPGSAAALAAADVLGLSYLEPYHSLQYQGTSLDQLSPGEKGTLLLMFYLLVDPARTPLLLDQPDENLDNHTIKDLLVPAIKEAASRRQVIVVTHNPNVAIVADADQIVVASRDGETFSYASGAIEDGSINLSAVDVLEGTWPALENRTQKYQRPEG